MGTPQGPILCSLFFLIYSNNLSNHSLSMVKQVAADDISFFIAHHAKTIAGEFLNSDLKASLNGHLYDIYSRSELGSKSYIFTENDKIISHTNLFQHLLSVEIYLNEKLNLYFTYLVRSFQINARNKRQSAF